MSAADLFYATIKPAVDGLTLIAGIFVGILLGLLSLPLIKCGNHARKDLHDDQR